MATLAGKSATFTTGGSSFKCNAWTLESSVDLLDDTNSASGGEDEHIVGVSYISGTVSFDLDTASHTLANFDPGTALTNVVCNADGGTKVVTVAAATVESLSMSMTTKGKIECTLAWKGNGTTLGTAFTAI